MKIYIATLELTKLLYRMDEPETQSHLLIGTSYKELVDKIDRYTHDELSDEEKESIISDLNLCRESRRQSDEYHEEYVFKIQDDCNFPVRNVGCVSGRPENNTVLYIYCPYNLKSATNRFTVEKYKNLDYFNKRIDSGLCYYDEKSVLERIEYELEVERYLN